MNEDTINDKKTIIRQQDYINALSKVVRVKTDEPHAKHSDLSWQIYAMALLLWVLVFVVTMR